MSEEDKMKLIAVAVVALLAVTLVVAGWQQGEEQVEIEVEVDEGYER